MGQAEEELLTQFARDLRKLMDLVEGQVTPELKRLAEKVEGPMPAILTYKAAAEKLSVGMTKLTSMVKTGEISSCTVGLRKMIPSSEIFRLAQPVRVKPRSSGGRPKKEPYNAQAEARKLAELRRAKNRKKR